MVITKKKKGFDKDVIFYIFGMLWPITQFVVFYIGVNFQSIMMAFQKYDVVTNSAEWTSFYMIDAIKQVFTSKHMHMLWIASLKVYFLSLVIGTPLGLFFAYAIYKKLPFHNGFRVFLFMPSILSAIVVATIYQFFVEQGLPKIIEEIFKVKRTGFLENPDSRFGTLLFYSIFVSFGTSVLMYSNAMSGISPEIVESAHLDGASGIREFWYISLPMVFPTLSTFLITGVVAIFSGQFNLYSFYGESAPEQVQTFGYYFYMKTVNAKSKAQYSPLAALGLIMSVFSIVITFGVKWLIEKFGPRED